AKRRAVSLLRCSTAITAISPASARLAELSLRSSPAHGTRRCVVLRRCWRSASCPASSIRWLAARTASKRCSRSPANRVPTCPSGCYWREPGHKRKGSVTRRKRGKIALIRSADQLAIHQRPPTLAVLDKDG